MRRLATTIALFGALAWSASLASAQAEPVTEPAGVAPPGALAGPAVAPAVAAEPTLIEHDFSGTLRRLESSAEEAALEKLTLSDEEKALTAAILRERAAIIDGVVGQNTGLLIRIQGLRTARTPDGVAAMREMARKLGPLRARGRLRDELAATLEIANQRRFVAMVDAYYEAAANDTLAQLRKEDPEATLSQAAARESLQAVGHEIRRSYERTLAEKTGRLDAIIEALGLDEAQEAKVRSIALEFGQKALGKPTRAQIRGLLTDIAAELRPDQREKFVRELYQARPAPSTPLDDEAPSSTKAPSGPMPK